MNTDGGSVVGEVREKIPFGGGEGQNGSVFIVTPKMKGGTTKSPLQYYNNLFAF